LISIHGQHNLRFQPLVLGEKASQKVLLETFVDKLKIDIQLIDASLSHRELFKSKIKVIDALENVAVIHHVGLGAVRFIPSYLSGTVLANDIKTEIDTLNSTLASRLYAENPIFYEGTTSDGSICVRVGVDPLTTTEDRVTELVNQLQAVLGTLKVSQKIHDTVANIIRKGIKDAENQIQRQASEQEGVLRKIPLVGGLWSWWSPTKSEPAGRTFDIASHSLQEIKKPPSSTNLAKTKSQDTLVEKPSVSKSAEVIRTPSENHRQHQSEQPNNIVANSDSIITQSTDTTHTTNNTNTIVVEEKKS